MRHPFSSLLSLHWAVAFAVLAALATDAQALSAMIGTTQGGGATWLLSLAFALVSMLFLWSLLTALFASESGGDREDVDGLAFSAAVAVLSGLLAIGALAGAHTTLFVTEMALVAALVTSRIAMRREGIDPARKADSVHASIRAMASEAAHQATLTRFSGRLDPTRGGR